MIRRELRLSSGRSRECSATDKEKTTEQMFKVCQYYDVKNVDLAESMCTSEVEVSNWKTGKRFPGWDKIMLFAYTVGLPLDIMILGKKA